MLAHIKYCQITHIVSIPLPLPNRNLNETLRSHLEYFVKLGGKATEEDKQEEHTLEKRQEYFKYSIPLPHA